MDKPIDIKKLSKTFRDKKRRKVEALFGLDLEIVQGEVFGFLGPNGAGKSTTIKSLMGLIKPTSGSARLFGVSVGDFRARERIGYLPENPTFYEYLTAREYLHMVGRLFRLTDREVKLKVAEVLELLLLSASADRPIRGYSKGMVQRLGLGQALIHDPELFILDEPMSGLDPIGRALVKDLMLELKSRGKTIFFSTHVIADVEAVCDRVAILVLGKLRAENAVKELISEGITGYMVRLEQHPPAELHNYLVNDTTEEHGKLYIPRSQFNDFMVNVNRLGCAVHLIEPQRQSLEDFFLKTIA